MLSEEYKKPMKSIRCALEEKDYDKAIQLHKSLMAKSGMWGYYYGSPLFKEVEGLIKIEEK